MATKQNQKDKQYQTGYIPRVEVSTRSECWDLDDHMRLNKKNDFLQNVSGTLENTEPMSFALIYAMQANSKYAINKERKRLRTIAKADFANYSKSEVEHVVPILHEQKLPTTNEIRGQAKRLAHVRNSCYH